MSFTHWLVTYHATYPAVTIQTVLVDCNQMYFAVGSMGPSSIYKCVTIPSILSSNSFIDHDTQPIGERLLPSTFQRNLHSQYRPIRRHSLGRNEAQHDLRLLHRLSRREELHHSHTTDAVQERHNALLHRRGRSQSILLVPEIQYNKHGQHCACARFSFSWFERDRSAHRIPKWTDNNDHTSLRIWFVSSDSLTQPPCTSWAHHIILWAPVLLPLAYSHTSSQEKTC
jgi:hypothetical protein